jgi:hypothetical protein
MAGWVSPYNSCSDADEQISLSLGAAAEHRAGNASTAGVLTCRVIESTVSLAGSEVLKVSSTS